MNNLTSENKLEKFRPFFNSANQDDLYRLLTPLFMKSTVSK